MAYSRPLMVAPNLLPRVLKKVFSLEMVKNKTYLWDTSKQNELFLSNSVPEKKKKTHAPSVLNTPCECCVCLGYRRREATIFYFVK